MSNNFTYKHIRYYNICSNLQYILQGKKMATGKFADWEIDNREEINFTNCKYRDLYLREL